MARINPVITLAEARNGGLSGIRMRPEAGPDQVWLNSGLLIPFTRDGNIAVFFLSSRPDSEGMKAICAYARSAGATVSLLLHDGPIGVRYHGEPGETPAWVSRLCTALSEAGEEPEFRKAPADIRSVRSGLIRYLTSLKKDLTGWLYHHEGETGRALRDLTVQCLMNQVLLSRIAGASGAEPGSVTTRSLLADIISFASSPPVHDQYDIRIPDRGTEGWKAGLQGRGVAMPEDIRITWIQPGTWASVFSALRGEERAGKRDRDGRFPSEEEEPVPLCSSDAGRWITRIITRHFCTTRVERLYDPAAGAGEIIGRSLELAGYTGEASEDQNTVISRLIRAGELVHATTPSPVHAAMIRCVVAGWILTGENRDNQLTGHSLRYPFMALEDHIRAGNILYRPDLEEEFFSRQAGYPSLRRLHPLDPGSLHSPCRFSLIVSLPPPTPLPTIPAVTAYLTRRYRSYQGGIAAPALLTEAAADLITDDGASIIGMPAGWLSDDAYRGFRRWVAGSLPASVLIREDEPREKGQDGSSVLCVRKRGEPVLTVRIIRREGEDNLQIRSYPLSAGELPREGGWRLHDPREERILARILRDQIPLGEYVFTEIYPALPEGIPDTPSGRWTSLHWNGSSLQVSLGDRPGPSAQAVIPGWDPYLIGVLSSSLPAWYLQIITRRMTQDDPDLFCRIRQIPVRAVDPYHEEETLLHSRVEEGVARLIFLAGLAKRARTGHDRDRILRQIHAARDLVDQAVYRLYGLSHDDITVIGGSPASGSRTEKSVTRLEIL